MIVIENVIQNGASVSFSIEGIGVHGLLFDNQATKTAWLDLLAGCCEPQAGQILLQRKDTLLSAVAQKRFIGYVPALLPLYEDMTAEELLDFIGEAKGIASDKRARQIKEALELMGLQGVSNRLIATLPTLNRRRLVFAQAVLGNPSVIVIDALYADMNAEQRRDMDALLGMLGRHKPITLGDVSSDILPLCTDVAVLDQNGIRFSGAATDLLAELTRAGAETAVKSAASTVSVADYFGFADEEQEEKEDGQ